MTYHDYIEAATLLPLPWEKLGGSNILITGASGLIGSCLVEILMERNERNYHVFASGRNLHRLESLFSKYQLDPFFHLFPFDVCNELVSDIDFHYIVHAASEAAPAAFSSHPVEIIKSNIWGVAHLFDYGRQHHLKRFLYVSSGEIYGIGEGQPFSENDYGYVDCLQHRSCYPNSKRTAETLCISYQKEYGLDVVIARPCHTYGPHFTEKDNRVYAQFIRNILSGEDIILKSSGEQLRSWCFVVDCATAILYILLKGASGDAYNIADPFSNITINQLAQIFTRIGGKKVIRAEATLEEKASFNKMKQSLFNVEKLSSIGWTVLPGSIEEKIQASLKKCIGY